jgi:tetratricopeptide (TPR) repeat protein
LYERQSRYADAEPLYKRSLVIREKALGPSHPDVALALNNLAGLYHAQGRYTKAEPLFKRSLAVREKTLGPDHARVGEALNNLAVLYNTQGRYTEAEPMHQRALALREKALGQDHPDVGTSLNNLALLYKSQGGYADAEPLYRRSLVIREKALGPNHPDVGTALNNLAALYRAQGRYAEAEPLYKRVLSIREKGLGLDHPSLGTPLNNLAKLYREQGRYAEAEPLYKRALSIQEKWLGVDHPSFGTSLNNLALLYWEQGDYAEAEPLYQRALAVKEKALGPDHPDVGQLLSNLAAVSFVQRDWASAAEYWRRSTALLIRPAQRGTTGVGQALTGKSKNKAERSSHQFWGLVRAAHRLAMQRRISNASLAREMFEMAQWAHGSEAASSLALMSVRGANRDAALGGLVRERQDLVEEWHKRDAERSAALSQSRDKRDRAAEAANVSRLTAIDARIAEIAKRLVANFPDYAALSRPTPLNAEDVQAQLGTDEALVYFFDTPETKPAAEETFIWIVTKTDLRWVCSDLGTAALTPEVAALRCGLDASSWEGVGSARCVSLLGTAAPHRNAPLPFDVARAHRLYKALFGEVEDLISDKHLLIVPSGPLTQLPFQVLVTSPTSDDYKSAAWLARKNAITVLPAVSSLKALRRIGKPSAAPRSMIAFGNPLLDGSDASCKGEARP